MLQTLLFFHILAAVGLFSGIAIEIVAVVRAHRAQTLAEVRAAVLNMPVIGPIMGLSALLLLAMGISMIYAGGFGWAPAWIQAVLGVTVLLMIAGPAINGRKADALHTLAAQAGEGAITPAVDAARRDRLYNYMVFLTLFELIAALYVMVTKPGAAPAAAVLVAAAIAAAVPAALLLRRTSRAITAQTSQT